MSTRRRLHMQKWHIRVPITFTRSTWRSEQLEAMPKQSWSTIAGTSAPCPTPPTSSQPLPLPINHINITTSKTILSGFCIDCKYLRWVPLPLFLPLNLAQMEYDICVLKMVIVFVSLSKKKKVQFISVGYHVIWFWCMSSVLQPHYIMNFWWVSCDILTVWLSFIFMVNISFVLVV